MTAPATELGIVEERPFPRVVFSNGAIELLKWFAFLAMIGDHVNVYIFDRELPYLFEFGRLAMPIFAIVLGYNLSRPEFHESNAYWRVIYRLLLSGLVSVPVILMLRHVGWVDIWPLNIMFLLLISTMICLLIDGGGWRDVVMALLLWGVTGFLVEFAWPGIALCVATWFYFRSGNWPYLLFALLGLLGVCALNGNMWALTSIPIIAVAAHSNFEFPRIRYVFYWLYPLHLGGLLLLQRL
jgi:hypothetical protein